MCKDGPPRKELSYPERLRTLGLPTLEYRRERADLIQIYKVLHDIFPVHKDKLFATAQYRATRGHSYKLHKERSRLNLRAGTFVIESLSPRTTKLWRGYRVCPVRMYVSTYVRTFVRSYVHPL